ncbi:GntR family transcriptional regulator [Paenibacillus sp. Marseille-Q4541]|uniref:GntR family transcriptional regulator n=1 Tax=Paenibacillus sp. Marseille-Q4541 TaxID=2831522 RepID=UPI001BA8DF51|nr:GntR family transcriptional regulator [Paenibacillus sp. Marseille-Q4541]
MDIHIRPTPTSTREAVYESLKEQILQFDLIPGTTISEKEIALSFHVSRTPVRESFLRLAAEGLLDVYPQRGTVVSLIDLELVEEARFLREQLECAVIRLACEHISNEALAELELLLVRQKATMNAQDDKAMFDLDEAFHKLLFDSCNKRNTWNAIQQMNVHLNRSRKLRLAADHNWQHLYDQHQQMVQAIREHDTETAVSLMKDHLHLTVQDQSFLKEKFPNYFKP